MAAELDADLSGQQVGVPSGLQELVGQASAAARNMPMPNFQGMFAGEGVPFGAWFQPEPAPYREVVETSTDPVPVDPKKKADRVHKRMSEEMKRRKEKSEGKADKFARDAAFYKKNTPWTLQVARALGMIPSSEAAGPSDKREFEARRFRTPQEQADIEALGRTPVSWFRETFGI